MEKIIGIYKIENIVNGKVYIGQSKNVYNRFRSHIKYETKSHLCHSIKKYGASNFKLTILERFSFYDKQELNDRECYWIYLYKAYNSAIGYNKTYGGEGVNPTSETIARMGEASRNRHYKASPEVKKLLSDKNKASKWITNGVEEYFKRIDDSFLMPRGFHYGRLPRSNEAKEKTSKSLIKTFRNTDEHTKKTRAKATSEKLMGHIVSEETKRKISKKNKEFYKNNPEARKRASSTRKGKIFITNGIEDRLVYELKKSDIDNGWYKGKSKIYYINNGLINKRISIREKLPSGWFLGKLKKENLEDEA